MNLTSNQQQYSGWIGLGPAVLGSAFAYLLSVCNLKSQIRMDSSLIISAIVIPYSIFSIAGLFYFMVEFRKEGSAKNDHSFTLISVGLGLGTAIVYFASIYTLIYGLSPQAFTGAINCAGIFDFILSFLYFSVTNITFLGYGDIVPYSASARVLVMLQTLFSFFTILHGVSTFSKI